MKTRRRLVFISAVVLLLAHVVRAGDFDVNITCEKKRDNLGKLAMDKAGDTEKRTENWKFTVTVQNTRSNALQGLDAKYIIFYKQMKFGEKGNGAKKTKNGDFQIASIPALGQISFDSESVTLTHQQLVGAYFGNGASGNAADTITGIWVRLYTSDGKLFAEAAYPEGLTSSEQWQ